MNIKKTFLMFLAVIVAISSMHLWNRMSDYFCNKLASRKRIISSVSLNFKEKNKEKKTDAIILLATRRSGSSIVGSIFNERHNVTFLYEPLFPFGKSGCGNDVEDNATSLLRSAATCHFENFKALYQPFKRDDAYSRFDNN